MAKKQRLGLFLVLAALLLLTIVIIFFFDTKFSIFQSNIIFGGGGVKFNELKLTNDILDFDRNETKLDIIFSIGSDFDPGCGYNINRYTGLYYFVFLINVDGNESYSSDTSGCDIDQRIITYDASKLSPGKHEVELKLLTTKNYPLLGTDDKLAPWRSLMSDCSYSPGGTIDINLLKNDLRNNSFCGGRNGDLVSLYVASKDFVVCKDKLCAVTTSPEEYQALLDKINSLETNLGEKVKLIYQLNATIQQKGEILKGLNLELSQQIEMVEKLASTIEEKATIINELELSISQQSEMIKKLTTKSEEQAQIINDLEITVQKKAELIQSLTSEIEKQGAIISKLELNLQEKVELINRLTVTNEEQATLIKAMKLSFSEQGEIINALNLKIDDDA